MRCYIHTATNEKGKEMFGPEAREPGVYQGISNAEYHAGPEVSKTTLDHVEASPGTVIWSRNAPEDNETKDALNLGDALHALLLEPWRFEDEFYPVHEPVERRSNAGKQRWAAIQAEAGNRPILMKEDLRKLMLMRDSVMAHPDAKLFLEAEGMAEPSLYWTDPETGLACRCRPDKALFKYNVCLDVKSTADMAKFWRSVAEYRYYVQDPFYSDGWQAVSGADQPRFLFLVVSTSINCGRYPVKLIELTDYYKSKGRDAYRRNLETYRKCQEANAWPGIELMDAPHWMK